MSTHFGLKTWTLTKESLEKVTFEPDTENPVKPSKDLKKSDETQYFSWTLPFIVSYAEMFVFGIVYIKFYPICFNSFISSRYCVNPLEPDT